MRWTEAFMPEQEVEVRFASVIGFETWWPCKVVSVTRSYVKAVSIAKAGGMPFTFTVKRKHAIRLAAKHQTTVTLKPEEKPDA